MATGKDWSESVVEVAGTKLHLARAGSGRPVLVLHHDIGSPDRLPFYDELASHFDVLVPHHPGYGKSERPQWLRNVRDVAVIYQWLLVRSRGRARLADRARLWRMDRGRDGDDGARANSTGWSWSERWA